VSRENHRAADKRKIGESPPNPQLVATNAQRQFCLSVRSTISYSDSEERGVDRYNIGTVTTETRLPCAHRPSQQVLEEHQGGALPKSVHAENDPWTVTKAHREMR
jgi:hypothetical protein